MEPLRINKLTSIGSYIFDMHLGEAGIQVEMYFYQHQPEDEAAAKTLFFSEVFETEHLGKKRFYQLLRAEEAKGFPGYVEKKPESEIVRVKDMYSYLEAGEGE